MAMSEECLVCDKEGADFTVMVPVPHGDHYDGLPLPIHRACWYRFKLKRDKMQENDSKRWNYAH